MYIGLDAWKQLQNWPLSTELQYYWSSRFCGFFIVRLIDALWPRWFITLKYIYLLAQIFRVLTLFSPLHIFDTVHLLPLFSDRQTYYINLYWKPLEILAIYFLKYHQIVFVRNKCFVYTSTCTLVPQTTPNLWISNISTPSAKFSERVRTNYRQVQITY